MPGPLSIACACPGAPGMTICNLISAQFQVTAKYKNDTWAADCGVALLAAAGGTWIVGTPTPDFIGSSSVGDFTATSDLNVPDLLANWDTMVLRFSIVSGLFQPLTDNRYASWMATWQIQLTYQCVDSFGNVITKLRYAKPTTGDECTEDWPGFIRSAIAGGSGGGVGLLYNSSIFTPAYCEINLEGWEPKPLDDGISFGDSVPDSICFCATGGTPPYQFLVAGSLPDGMSLDPTTGCLTGVPGQAVSAATTTIEVTVIDAVQDRASVTCNLFEECGAGETVGNSFY